MDENKQVVDELLKKKSGDYNADVKNNFSIPHELTVTITLNEYRELVIEAAKKAVDIDKANDRWRQELIRGDRLEKEKAELMNKLIETQLKSKGESECESEGEQDGKD